MSTEDVRTEDVSTEDVSASTAYTLYGYWRSSASWRVRIALHHKGLAFETVPVHLVEEGGRQHQAAHLARNPMGQVPALQTPDGMLTQSLAIIEYLDARHLEPGLLSADPFLR
ncbi:MAG: maleylacetoacetate isomerase, partial [Bradymonadia bacterium]